MIAEAKNMKPFRLNYARTAGVCLFSVIRKMLPAIELDYELGGMTDEIGNIEFDRNLAPETGAVKPMIPQRRPEYAFGIGGVFSKRARVRAEFGGDSPGWTLLLGHRDLRCGDTPTPTLPRKRERGLTVPDG